MPLELLGLNAVGDTGVPLVVSVVLEIKVTALYVPVGAGDWCSTKYIT